MKVPTEAVLPRPVYDRSAHVGVHKQKQGGLNWIGVVLPVAKLTAEQMRGLAKIAQDLGDGDYPAHGVAEFADFRRRRRQGCAGQGRYRCARPHDRSDLDPRRLVACTGNVGCRFSASDTKRHAEDIARWCEARVELDGPVNIHLTGCHHSCAQHYIGDIGLIACKVDVGEDADPVEGYHIHVGGGFGPDAGLGNEIYRDVKAPDAPRTVERNAQGLSRASRLARRKLSPVFAPA